MNTWSVPGYTESRELGCGGSGRVVLAVHDATGVPVAVKYLSERMRTDSGFVQEFRAEARLLGDLDSPHVVGLYEYVEAPQGAAIVMELVDGTSLRALLLREGATGPEAALTVLKGSLLGLAAAHRAGVVHRDYKPENVLVAADGSSKLVDFGIAAGRGDTPGVAGTPAYMAPEQWNGEPASPAADVYAATATFYECLTGRKPYTGDNFAELALQHISAPVPEEQAPDPVRPLIRRGLAKAPQERPENAAAFVAELEEIANAAYGPHWEERGQRKLAALAALLPLLLPSPTGQAAGTTELATTAVGGAEGRSWTPSLPGALAGAAALILAVVAAVAAAGPSADTPHRTTARTVATTSALPLPATGAPHGPTASASRSPADSTTAVPSPSPPGSPSGPPSESPAAIPAGPSPVMSPTAAGPPDPSATPASPSPSAPATTPTASVRVKSLSITGLRQTSPTGATATLAVTTDGTGPVTLDVVWFAGDTKGEPGPQDSSQTLRRSGATQYTITLDHTFRTGGCYWTVHATTHPAAANGSSSQQILTRRCSVQ